jgi:multicomponent Na+:H+ antiporter subunit D
MSQCLCVVIVTFGLLLAFITYAMRWIKIELCLPFAILVLGFLSFSATSLFIHVLIWGPFEYALGGWAPPIGIAYNVDQLNSFMVFIVTLVALVNMMANWKGLNTFLGDRIGGFCALYILYVSGLNGILLTGDLFNLYVLLEIASLTGYALLAIGDKRFAPFASINYVFLGTIGACFYLLGVGYLYVKTGSLNMLDVSRLIKELHNSPTILSAFMFIIIGVWTKMGLFPFHTWLPRAYTHTFGAISSLIAPMGTKVMAYVMFRVILTVFGINFVFGTSAFPYILTTFAVAAILFGSIFALRQTHLKRMLCFVVITEIGYLVSGLAIGNSSALKGSILHMLNDVFMTFCLFLSSQAIVDKMGAKIEGFSQLFVKTPFIAAIFLAGALSVIGIPPTCGFFGKWFLLLGAIEKGSYALFCAIVLSSLLNLILFFRIIEVAFYGGRAIPTWRITGEFPWSFYGGLTFAGLSILVMGLSTFYLIRFVIEPFLMPLGL